MKRCTSPTSARSRPRRRPRLFSGSRAPRGACGSRVRARAGRARSSLGQASVLPASTSSWRTQLRSVWSEMPRSLAIWRIGSPDGLDEPDRLSLELGRIRGSCSWHLDSFRERFAPKSFRRRPSRVSARRRAPGRRRPGAPSSVRRTGLADSPATGRPWRTAAASSGLSARSGRNARHSESETIRSGSASTRSNGPTASARARCSRRRRRTARPGRPRAGARRCRWSTRTSSVRLLGSPRRSRSAPAGRSAPARSGSSTSSPRAGLAVQPLATHLHRRVGGHALLDLARQRLAAACRTASSSVRPPV